MALTGNRVLDMGILQNLNDNELQLVCQANERARSICNSDEFWIVRIIRNFGQNAVYAHVNGTWKNHYLGL